MQAHRYVLVCMVGLFVLIFAGNVMAAPSISSISPNHGLCLLPLQEQERLFS